MNVENSMDMRTGLFYNNPIGTFIMEFVYLHQILHFLGKRWRLLHPKWRILHNAL